MSPAGDLLRLEREAGWTAVPGPVLTRFAKEHPGAKVDAARRVEKGASTGWIVVAGKTEAFYPEAAPFEIRAGRPFEKTFPGEARLHNRVLRNGMVCGAPRKP